MDTFNPSQMPPIQAEPEKKSVGPLVAVIIILALIVFAGLYFLKTRSEQKVYTPPAQAEMGDATTNSLNKQGSGDDLNSIEADLKATDLNNLDQGAAAVEATLQ